MKTAHVTIETETEEPGREPTRSKLTWQQRPWGRSGGDAVYGLGFIGAVIYYIQHAASFGAGVLGFLKAIVWPVFMVYHLLSFLKL